MPDERHRSLLLDRQLDGVDSTSEGILIPDSAWKRHHNMRSFNGRLQQVPRKVQYGQLSSCYPHEVVLLANLPAGRLDYGNLVAVTKEHVWQIRPAGAIKLSDLTGAFVLEYDAQYRRFGSTVYNGQLFFVNELNPVAATDGVSVRYLVDAPKARYIVHYFDHLVVANVIQDGIHMPERMLWGDLYKTSIWRPGRGNESDHWDFSEDETGLSALRGITGIATLGDTLYVLTPTSIRPVSYVGLPKVFRVHENVSHGIGNSLAYGLVKANNTLFFFDANEFNFFSFNGQLTPIGSPVQGYLNETASTDTEIQQRTWAYHHPEVYEVVWVYVSKDSSTFDKAVSFNYRTGKWYTRSVENIHSFAGRIRRSIGIDEKSGTAGALSGSAGELGNSETLIPRMWGGADGILYREETSSDDLSFLLTQEVPVLETRDFHYGDLGLYKEIDTIVPHTSYVEAKGVQAECAPRDYVDDPVVYRDQHLWTPETAHKRITDLRYSGRLFRFRFKPVSRKNPVVVETECAIPIPVPHGSLYVSLTGGSSPWVASDYVPVGPSGSYIFDAYMAPPELQYIYVYSGNENDDPYAEENSSAMLADAATQAVLNLSGSGYDGFTTPAWQYVPVLSPPQGQDSRAYPGWDTSPVAYTRGWVIVVTGFYFANEPDLTGGVQTVSLSDTKSLTVGGTVGVSYLATIRVRAVAPYAGYTGGTNQGSYYIGGSPASATREFIKLTASNPAATLYLNPGVVASYNVPIDYTFTLPVVGGSTLTLEINNRDGTQFNTGISGQPVRVSGYQPSSNIWARVDYSLALASGTARTITTRTGGGVRGWKWSGWMKNVYNGGAEK